MSKSVIISILVLLLAGGGFAYAGHGSGFAMPGVKAVPDNFEDDAFLEAVELDLQNDQSEEPNDSDQDLLGDPDDQLAADPEEEPQNPEDENGTGDQGDKGNGEQRSEVANSVHEVLSAPTGLKPGDEGFGQAVSENAREGGLGQKVSEAARSAAGNKPNKGAGNPNKGAGKP